MLKWEYLTSAVNDAEKTVYMLDGVEIARLTRRTDGTWQALMNQHRPGEPRYVRACYSLESGKRGVEIWAERHRAELESDVARIRAHMPNWMGGKPR